MSERSADIHARLGGSWPAVLLQLGVSEEFLRIKKAGPCPTCGGTDRYTFDNRRGRGDFLCRGCGAGDGFTLLQRVHGWDFREARKRVIAVAGLESPVERFGAPPRRTEAPPSATPTRRVLDVLRSACHPADVADVREYLTSRELWPLASDCTLHAHASAEFWHERQRVGRFAALLAEVRDVAGELVTVHVTYLAAGQKLAQHQPRKILSPLTGRTGCAARLLPLEGDELGVGEGIETCLAAHQLHELPVWAALNTSLLAKFEPPAHVRTLVVFADRDTPGLEAAVRLLEHLQGRLRVEVRVPPAPANDWADVLVERGH